MTTEGTPAEATAVISSDEAYRYRLSRTWDPERPFLTFVMLNPSTADAEKDDATIRKCRGFAERLGLGGIVVVNLFAYRARKPADMWRAAESGVDIVGPENETWLRFAASEAKSYGIVIAAWGANVRHREARGRPARVLSMLRAEAPVYALEVTKDGVPGHPLMLTYALTPRIYEGTGR